MFSFYLIFRFLTSKWCLMLFIVLLKSRKVLIPPSIMVLLIISGCSGMNSRSNSISSDARASINELLTSKDGRGVSDEHIQAGIENLIDHNYKKASQAFSSALRYDPQNSYVQFLNGLSYHLMAEAGDSSQYEFAKIGYQLAIKFNKNNWLASKQLARLFLKTKNYPLAQENFAYALLYQPDNAQLLYGLAQASYYAQDLQTAIGAIKRAQELTPKDPDILAAAAIIAAASGQAEHAKADLDLYAQIEPNKMRVELITERVSDWLKIHENKGGIPVPGSIPEITSTIPVSKPTENITAAGSQATAQVPRMAIIDVVMIRTEEGESTSKGVNLLEGLGLQFSDSFLSFTDILRRDLINNTRTNTSERTTSSVLSLKEVNYNLNIFNLGEDKTEVLARPTLVALEGQKSTFFSGSQLSVAVSGNDVANLEKIDVGVRLEITPTFVTDDTLVIAVTVGRAFIEPGVVGSFTESVRVSKNEVNANVALKFGQTLVLSGLREKQTSEAKYGVPFLRDLPLVQYLFSHEKTEDYHKSIITIITPRRVLPGVYVSSSSFESGESVKEEAGKQPYLEELRSSSTTLLSVDQNIGHIMRHLDKHRAVREFRETDLFDKVWYGSGGDLGGILKKTITFLYY